MLAIHDEVAAEVLEEPKQADKTWEVVFKTWDGEEIRRVGQEGESVMELGKREELGAMEGVCGGVLEVSRDFFFIFFCSCWSSKRKKETMKGKWKGKRGRKDVAAWFSFHLSSSQLYADLSDLFLS